jgi:RNA polymerase sigma-70 factor (ECF subfamily)
MPAVTVAVRLPSLITSQIPKRDSASSEHDLRLARACADGNSDVFAELYRSHSDRMKSIAYNHLGNISDAEDAVQETFLKIHRAAMTYTGEAAFSTWLYRILINTCYDLLRRRQRRIQETSIDDDLSGARASVATDDVKRIALRKMLNDLPEQRRSVFTLFEIEGMSHAEIAQILDISEGNSKWILFATKKQLQEKWKTSQ